MQKDFKIGMLVGLVVAMAATLWLATRPSLTPQAEIPDAQNVAAWHDPSASPDELPETGSIPEDSGNTQSATVNSPITLPDFTVYEQRDKIRTQKFHIVRRRETLSAISHKYYGSATKWQKIFEANRNIIKDPHRITPGTKLIIPD
jgi:nucleoid-associated protein YgaU